MKKLKNIPNVKALRIWDVSGNIPHLIALASSQAMARAIVEDAADTRRSRNPVMTPEQALNTFLIDERPMAVYGSRMDIWTEARKADRGAREGKRTFMSRAKYLVRKAWYSVV